MIELEISDHALLRWMERMHGVDIDGFRELMRQEVRRACDLYEGDAPDGVPRFVIVDRCVVTVIGADQKITSKRRDGVCVPASPNP